MYGGVEQQASYWHATCLPHINQSTITVSLIKIEETKFLGKNCIAKGINKRFCRDIMCGRCSQKIKLFALISHSFS